MRATKIFRIFVLTMTAVTGRAQQAGTQAVIEVKPPEAPPRRPQSPLDSITENTVTIGGQQIEYRAVAGTITVGGTDAFDALLASDGQLLADAVVNPTDPAKPEDAPARARLFYTAYFRKSASAAPRPITFFYNGGPGSSTMWLHMGSFGPRRVAIPDTEHKTGAPYSITDNPYSLLDVTDMVFIDMPGAGFSRIMGKDKEKAFWGVDQDAHAFERFIRRFLTKYDRWNSPKYLFGESYGTPRSAVLSALLKNIDLNGIVLLSAILNFDNSVDGVHWNPGTDQPYALALPTYAATAFYHHKLPQQPAALQPFLREVETFALGEYSSALLAGSLLPENQQRSIAEKLHRYTGLPLDYILKANLRVAGGEFSKTLQDADGLTTGRIDTRYRGPDLNRLSGEAEYDPQASAISAAYATAINEYVRTELKFGKEETYKPNVYDEIGTAWDFHHKAPPGPPDSQGFGSATNVMPDLAFTMKSNPKMRVMLAGGYFDLATPYFEGIYEMHHLPIPQSLQQNISYKYYESGHMVYLNESVLRQFRADVVQFVHDTESGK
jgi:carboxypeptidase C (cathepsin A)